MHPLVLYVWELLQDYVANCSTCRKLGMEKLDLVVTVSLYVSDISTKFGRSRKRVCNELSLVEQIDSGQMYH